MKIKIHATLCLDATMMRPVYEQRQVSEGADLNWPERQSFVRACSAQAKAQCMFSHLK